MDSEDQDYRAAIVRRICTLLLEGDKDSAIAITRAEYPFTGKRPELIRPAMPTLVAGGMVVMRDRREPRGYNEIDKTGVFVRDGFLDRYSGQKLVSPAVLRLLSRLLPDEFPCHPHGKMEATHAAHWELFPVIDHFEPIAGGGQNVEANWVTTSATRNLWKSNWTMEERGWVLRPIEANLRRWDGLTGWFVAYVERHPDELRHGYFRRWHRAIAPHRVLLGI